METLVKEKETYKNIDKACENIKSISDNIINPKFKHIDLWINKKSKTFINENKVTIKKTYPRFEYGTILKVDFGINDGSEISGPHFAISLERYDSTKNPVLTVLPLTSQEKEHYLPLSDLITDEFTKRLQSYLTRLANDPESSTLKENNTLKIELSEKRRNEIDTLKKMISYYSSYAKSSYACINQITTISKDKIIRPKNKFDIIGRAKCNSKTMQVISQKLISKYTNMKF